MFNPLDHLVQPFHLNQHLLIRRFLTPMLLVVCTRTYGPILIHHSMFNHQLHSNLHLQLSSYHSPTPTLTHPCPHVPFLTFIRQVLHFSSCNHLTNNTLGQSLKNDSVFNPYVILLQTLYPTANIFLIRPFS